MAYGLLSLALLRVLIRLTAEAKAFSAKLRAAFHSGLDADLVLLANSTSAAAAQRLRKEIEPEVDGPKEGGEEQR